MSIYFGTPVQFLQPIDANCWTGKKTDTCRRHFRYGIYLCEDKDHGRHIFLGYPIDADTEILFAFAVVFIETVEHSDYNEERSISPPNSFRVRLLTHQ